MSLSGVPVDIDTHVINGVLIVAIIVVVGDYVLNRNLTSLSMGPFQERPHPGHP